MKRNYTHSVKAKRFKVQTQVEHNINTL